VLIDRAASTRVFDLTCSHTGRHEVTLQHHDLEILAHGI
jgi:hypothetical protein